MDTLPPTIFENHCLGHATGLPGLLFTQVINYLIASQCSLANPKHYPKDYGDEISENEKFDFIVVGAGIKKIVLIFHFSLKTNQKF